MNVILLSVTLIRIPMPSVILLSVIPLNVILLGGILQNVVALKYMHVFLPLHLGEMAKC